MEAEWKKFQDSFLDHLKMKIESRKLVDTVSETLQISNSSAYKKIKGDTMLGLDEVITLASNYHISLDQFLNYKSAPIPFLNDALRKMPLHPMDFIQNLQNHLNQLTALKNLSYINLAGEIPIFHFMPFHKLFAFKLYAWNFTSWSIPKYEDKFDLNIFVKDEALMHAIDTCAHTYYHFSGIEIWNIRMIDNTLDQLKYFIHMRVFHHKSIAQEICSELFDLLDHLQKICITGTKRFETKDALNKSSVNIYMNEIVHSNEVIFVSSDLGDHLYCVIDAPNLIRTSDKKMTAYAKSWLLKTKKHSTQISGEGEKERRVLFEKLFSKMEKSRIEINSLLNYVYS